MSISNPQSVSILLVSKLEIAILLNYLHSGLKAVCKLLFIVHVASYYIWWEKKVLSLWSVLCNQDKTLTQYAIINQET